MNHIENIKGEKVKAQTQFNYHGFVVSISTIFVWAVAVFDDNNVHCGDFDTVEAAIEDINRLTVKMAMV